MSSKVSIDTSAIKKWVKHLDTDVEKDTQRFINLALKKAANIVQRAEMKKVSRGVTGGLARSIHQVVTEYAAVVGPDHKMVPHYALDVEKGTKPHMPPISAIEAWANAKGINPWALAMSIKKRGTLAHPFVKPTYEETKEQVILQFRGAQHLIVDFLKES